MRKLSKKLSTILALAIMLTGVFGMPIAAAEELTETEYDVDAQTFSSLDELKAVEGVTFEESDSYYGIDSARRSDVISTGYSMEDGKSNFIPMLSDDTEGQRAMANINGFDAANLTNTLTTSNPYDIIYFSASEARSCFVNLSSVNSGYYAQLGYIDSAGYLYLYNAVVPAGGYVRWNIGTTNSSFPYYAIVVQSIGTLGDSYTLTWNKIVPTANISQLLYVSPDLAEVVTLVAGNNYIAVNNVSTIYLGNGGTAAGDGSTQLEWGGGWNVTIGGVGYNRRDINIYDVHINRANLTYESSLIMEYTKNAPGTAYSSLAIALELDMNTYYHTFRSSYTQATGVHWYNQDDYLGIPTARYLFTGAFPIENMSTDKHHVIVDVASGTPIDIYGNHNMFYSVDGYQLPTIVYLPKIPLL